MVVVMPWVNNWHQRTQKLQADFLVNPLSKVQTALEARGAAHPSFSLRVERIRLLELVRQLQPVLDGPVLRHPLLGAVRDSVQTSCKVGNETIRIDLELALSSYHVAT